jgi:hypothetical protein
MSEDLSRRDWIKTVGIVGAAGALNPLEVMAATRQAVTPAACVDAVVAPTAVPAPLRIRDRYAPGDIVELYSTSDVFIPPKGRSFMKFSFDFPEPGVMFGDHRFSFLVFTDENTYSLDRARMKASGTGDALQLTCDSFVWAGGQEKAPGKLTATCTKSGTTIEWDIVV